MSKTPKNATYLTITQKVFVVVQNRVHGYDRLFNPEQMSMISLKSGNIFFSHFAQNRQLQRSVGQEKNHRKYSIFFLWICIGQEQLIWKEQLLTPKFRYFGTPYSTSLIVTCCTSSYVSIIYEPYLIDKNPPDVQDSSHDSPVISNYLIVNLGDFPFWSQTLKYDK